MKTPFVSVIMPVFNVADFVAEAVRSVLDQSYRHFDLVIVDDGGSDDSIAICRGFTDKRIRIVAQANRGLAGARNTGIAASRGEFIALLDSDDRWHPDKLLLHVIHLQANPAVGVSYSGSRMIDARSRVMGVAMQPRLEGIAAAHILKRNPVGNGSAPVIRRSALNEAEFAHPLEPARRCWFDESFRQSEDIELWIRLAAKHGCVFEGIAGLLTDYRIVGGGLSANIPRQYESWQRAIEKARGYAPELIARHGRMAAAYQLRYLARRAVQLGDAPFAASLIRQALAMHPAILLAEPAKTLQTAVAAFAARLLPRKMFAALLRARLGSESVA